MHAQWFWLVAVKIRIFVLFVVFFLKKQILYVDIVLDAT